MMVYLVPDNSSTVGYFPTEKKNLNEILMFDAVHSLTRVNHIYHFRNSWKFYYGQIVLYHFIGLFSRFLLISHYQLHQCCECWIFLEISYFLNKHPSYSNGRLVPIVIAPVSTPYHNKLLLQAIFMLFHLVGSHRINQKQGIYV